MKRLLLLLVGAMLAISFSACSDDGGDSGNDGADPNPGVDPEPDGMNPDPNPTPNPTPMPGVDPQPDPQPEGDVCPDPDGCPEADPSTYDFDANGSFFSEVILVTDPAEGEDLNGDGVADNALGGLLNDLGGLLGDVDINAQLAEAIADGTLLLGAKWPGYEGGDSGDVTIHFLALEVGGEEYVAARSSFIEGTASPAIQFHGAAVAGGSLTAGPADFSITIPLGGIALSLVVSDARVLGDISSDGAGIAVNNGRIAGAVSLQSVVDALNGFLQSDNCSCLGLQAPLIDLSAGVGPQACSMDFDDSTCEAEDQGICSTIAGACILAVPVIAGQTDIDLSGDGSPDAISVAIDLTLEGASISGLGQ